MSEFIEKIKKSKEDVVLAKSLTEENRRVLNSENFVNAKEEEKSKEAVQMEFKGISK